MIAGALSAPARNRRQFCRIAVYARLDIVIADTVNYRVTVRVSNYSKKLADKLNLVKDDARDAEHDSFDMSNVFLPDFPRIICEFPRPVRFSLQLTPVLTKRHHPILFSSPFQYATDIAAAVPWCTDMNAQV